MPQLALVALRTVWESARGPLLRSMACQVLTAVLVGVQIYVVKELVSGLIRISDHDGGVSGHVILSFAVLVLVGAAIGALNAVMLLQERLLAELVARHVLDRIIDVSTRVPLSLLEDSEYYDHLQRAVTAGTFRPMQMVTSLMTLLLGLLTSIGVVIAILTLEPLLVPLVALAALPVLLSTLYNSRLAYVFEYQLTSHARERLHLMEVFTERDAAKELRVFSAIGYLRRRYDRLSDERIVRVREFLRQRFTVAMVGTLGTSLGTAIALGALVFLLADHRIGVATATTAAVAMQVLAGQLSGITGSLGTLLETSLFLTDLQAFLAQGERQAEAVPGHGDPGDFQELRFDGVSFTYPGTEREVLHDVSMEVHRGEVVALVGENGSGKTTLVKLLCRLYEHQGGISWNGQDVAEIEPERLRSGMTVLFQDFVHYHLTAEENIGLGRSDVPLERERIEEAARRAGADEVIAQLPRGMQTRLGREFDGGAELSGGQWQRLALARAFYRGGEFLILDEPTAALDPRAEHRLFEHVRELAAGRTVLLISHRFSSVRMADRIYVLQDGRVAETGDHDALVSQDGLYAELYRLQARTYLEDSAA